MALNYSIGSFGAALIEAEDYASGSLLQPADGHQLVPSHSFNRQRQESTSIFKITKKKRKLRRRLVNMKPD